MSHTSLNPKPLNSRPPMYVDEDGHVHVSDQINDDGDAGDPSDSQYDGDVLEDGGGDEMMDGDGDGDEEEDDEEEDEEEDEIPIDGETIPDPNLAVPLRFRSMNQLTLSFNGEVYVYPSVSPDKVCKNHCFICLFGFVFVFFFFSDCYVNFVVCLRFIWWIRTGGSSC